jgi:chromosome segregation ATPase
MPDVVRNVRDEEAFRRTEAQNYQLQQQMDELRRQLREAVARQQWLEELYKQNEGRLAQVQLAQDQFVQSITQTINARQVDDQRVKQQIAELAPRVDEPMKVIRELRAQLSELADSRRADRERVTADLRQYEGLQSQLREMVGQIGMIADAQRQLRDLVHDLDTVNAETRQEIQRVGELQRMEEQRLRRQGVELQEIVEGLRLQFQDTVSRSQRIDDVRRQVMEHIEALEDTVGEMQQEAQRQDTILQRMDKQILDNHLAVQERAEAVRAAFEIDLAEVRQSGDQRTDRHIGRFQQIDDRLRDLEQRLAELPPLFDRLSARDLEIEAEREQVEELHLRREIEALDAQLQEMRARRAQKQAELAKRDVPGLIRNVREARPPARSDDDYPTDPGGSR